MSLVIVPLELDEANAMVARFHRHLSPARGHRYSIGVVADGVLIGAAIIGRPVSRGVSIRDVIEVTRCATDGTANACSCLYGAAARTAKGQGYHKIQTYNLDEESGSSLRAAGYVRVASVKGRAHVHTDGAPRANEALGDKGRWERVLNLPAPRFSIPADEVPQLSLLT